MTFALVVQITVVLALAVFAAGMRSRASAASRHIVLMCGLVSVLWLPLAHAITPSLPVPVLRTDAVVPLPENAAHPVANAAVTAAATTDGAPAVTATQARPVAATATAPSRPWPWLLLVWSAGAALVVSRMVAGRWLSHRLQRECPEGTDERIVTMTRTIAQEMGIARTITIVEAPSNVMPATWGVAGPVLLLPRCARDWPDRRLRLVLTHELSHIARLDALASAIARVATACAWWHPLAWVASCRAQLERERACDDAVLRTGVPASEYAGELLLLAQSLAPMRHATMAMARMPGLVRRVTAILDARQRRAAGSRLVTIMATAALVLEIPITAATLESRPVWPSLPSIEPALTSSVNAHFNRARETVVASPAQTGSRTPAISRVTIPNIAGHWRMEVVPPAVEYSTAQFVAPFGDEFMATQNGQQLALEYVPHSTFTSGRGSGRGSVAQVRIPDQHGRAVFQFDGTATNHAGWQSFSSAMSIGPDGHSIGTGMSGPMSSGEGWDNCVWEGRVLNITSTKVTNGVTSTSTRRLHLDGAVLVVDSVEGVNTASPVPRTARYVRATGPMPDVQNGKAVPAGRFGAGAYWPGAGIPAPLRKPPFVEPTYTEDARRAGIEGYVEIDAIVDADGRVSQAQIARSLDPRLGLDDNAIDVVRRSTFRPCTAFGNTPLPCLVTFEVAYFLSSGK